MRNQVFSARERSGRFPKRIILLILPLLIWTARSVHGSEPVSEPALNTATAQKAGAAKTDPWTEADLIRPEELARALARRGGEGPTLVYVGFPLLFKAGRIPGAVYFGAGRNPEDVARLREWARGLGPNERVVMYCGCCPWNECPNVRPAFKALRAAGLRHLKLLYLPTGLLADWVEKGYPFEKAASPVSDSSSGGAGLQSP